MWTCPQCGERIRPGFEFCWRCGVAEDGGPHPDFHLRTTPEAEREETIRQIAPQPSGRVSGAVSGAGYSARIGFCAGVAIGGLSVLLLIPEALEKGPHVLILWPVITLAAAVFGLTNGFLIGAVLGYLFRGISLGTAPK